MLLKATSMDPADFKDTPSGVLISTVAGQAAFVPHPLPPKLDLRPIIGPLAETAAQVGKLNGIATLIENPFLVIRPLQRLEALLSSAMEGTYTTANALALAEAGDPHIDQSTREVFNYISAFTEAHRMLEKLPISNRLIKLAHQTLLGGLGNSRSKRPGQFKDQQNFIGGATRRIEDARFVPPPPVQTENLMADLEKYINREHAGEIPPLIDAALVHYQFETIHPFSDGNGRIGRMLITLQMQQAGLIDLPILYVSPAVAGRKQEYADRMLAVSRDGAWTEWILFFLEIVRETCSATSTTIGRLIELQTEYRRRLSEAGASSRLNPVLESLFIKPVTDIPSAQVLMGVTYPTAASGIRKLVEYGILQELEFTSHPKRFICSDVISITDPDIGSMRS